MSESARRLRSLPFRDVGWLQKCVIGVYSAGKQGVKSYVSGLFACRHRHFMRFPTTLPGEMAPHVTCSSCGKRVQYDI